MVSLIIKMQKKKTNKHQTKPNQNNTEKETDNILKCGCQVCLKLEFHKKWLGFFYEGQFKCEKHLNMFLKEQILLVIKSCKYGNTEIGCHLDTSLFFHFHPRHHLTFWDIKALLCPVRFFVFIGQELSNTEKALSFCFPVFPAQFFSPHTPFYTSLCSPVLHYQHHCSAFLPPLAIITFTIFSTSLKHLISIIGLAQVTTLFTAFIAVAFCSPSSLASQSIL